MLAFLSMHGFQKVSQSSLLVGEIRFYSGNFFVVSDMIEPVSLLDIVAVVS